MSPEHTLIAVLIFLSFVAHAPGITQRTKYVLYTNPQSWNNARSICEDAGEMLIISGEVIQEALEKFSYGPEWSTQIDQPWIGLQVHEEETSSYKFFWTDCDEANFKLWDSAEPNSMATDMCIRIAKVDNRLVWRTWDCFEEKQFICAVPLGWCAYNCIDNMMLVENKFLLQISVTQSTLEACKSRCDSEEIIGKECWGLMYNQQTSLCRLLLTWKYSALLLHTSSSPGSQDTFCSKECFEADVNTTTVKVVPNMSSQNPQAYCFKRYSNTVALNSQLLTTESDSQTVFNRVSTLNSELPTHSPITEQLFTVTSSIDHSIYTQIAPQNETGDLLETTSDDRMVPTETGVTTSTINDVTATENIIITHSSATAFNFSQLINELKVNKGALSRRRAMYTSAYDPRVSSKCIGSFGIVIMCVFFGIAILTDIWPLRRRRKSRHPMWLVRRREALKEAREMEAVRESNDIIIPSDNGITNELKAEDDSVIHPTQSSGNSIVTGANIHMSSAMESKGIPCAFCPFYVSVSSEMTGHLKSHHLDCVNERDVPIATTDGIDKHVEIQKDLQITDMEEASVQSIPCVIPPVTATGAQLQLSKERLPTIPCVFCTKCFSTNAQLNVHLGTHFYCCDVCGKSFASEIGLETHREIAHGDMEMMK